MNANLPRVGRPRDPAKDHAVLVAARKLLGEVGYQQTTISAIARRAAVSAPAIYRRWPSREALLEEAVHGSGGRDFPEPTDDLRADLLTWTRIFLARAASPAARAGIPGLLADATTEEDRQRLLALQDPVRSAFAERLEIAVRGGEIPGPADAATLFEILTGATSIRGLTQGNLDAEEFVAALGGALYTLACHGADTAATTKGDRS
ncbi:TetR/AcrR family transcriptional regulator [Rhodococcus sp. SGAir0479]|uniref:TetR/AcrR family transcriptional regulator n=1 Tax=Rhodococcus sp. SGAir0479 TaxID=2567884 RepID=UPI0010CD58BE|nr:TetR/AcrR family transcriptional regulator [Rhodococcus sp. SGAir0479]QCQ89942.1 TetR/AcrR family transcriptional regulator [Rhodococcus sp. SGAir0479]